MRHTYILFVIFSFKIKICNHKKHIASKSKQSRRRRKKKEFFISPAAAASAEAEVVGKQKGSRKEGKEGEGGAEEMVMMAELVESRPWRLCVSMGGGAESGEWGGVEDVLRGMRAAKEEGADVVELRLDSLSPASPSVAASHLPHLLTLAPLPTIVCCRYVSICSVSICSVSMAPFSQQFLACFYLCVCLSPINPQLSKFDL